MNDIDKLMNKHKKIIEENRFLLIFFLLFIGEKLSLEELDEILTKAEKNELKEVKIGDAEPIRLFKGNN